MKRKEATVQTTMVMVMGGPLSPAIVKGLGRVVSEGAGGLEGGDGRRGLEWRDKRRTGEQHHQHSIWDAMHFISSTKYGICS